ncbi:MAG TPA: hypothetical protein VEO37_05195 [Thermoanaerobaculia bacterium]|nr:hypothetical protein [Thermoanaerobaculia bacterium]
MRFPYFRAVSSGLGIWLVNGLLAAVVVVNDPSDVLHGGPGGCALTGTGTCTLRDAITFVNATPAESLILIKLAAQLHDRSRSRRAARRDCIGLDFR